MIRELRPIRPYVRRYRKAISIGLVLVVVSNIFTLAWPYLLKLAIDALETGIAARGLAAYAAGIVALALIGGAAKYGMREYMNGMSRRVECDLRDGFFAHLLRMSPEFYSRYPTGELMSRGTNDILAVRQVVGPAIMYLVNTTVTALVALSMMVWIDPTLTLLAMIPLVTVPPVTLYFGREIHRRFEAIQAQFGRLSTFAQENLAGVRIVRAYTQEDAQAAEFGDLNREYLGRNMQLAKIWGLFHPALMLLTGLGAVIVLYVGGRSVIQGQITIGDFVAFTFYLMMLTWPMISLGWVVNLFERGAASMGRIQEVMQQQPAIREPADPVRLDSPKGGLEFRNVWFRYPGTERWVLRDVSFRVEPGQTVAVVGPTGAGKTSIVRLIPRLYDADRGEVLVDGVPVDRLSLDQLRELIAMVPQEPFLFSESLGANIAFAMRDGAGDRPEARADDSAQHAQIAAAVEIAQLAETIREFPRGLETQLGERGINLSGGQKQRTTLARALTRDAAVLILDDALSSVDTKTEAAILKGLSSVLEERTSLIISHRVTAVKDADHILVVDDGEIVERGVHDELIAAGGTYARLLRRQLLEESLEAEQPA